MYKLYSNTTEYKEYQVSRLESKRSRYKAMFLILNLISLMASLTSSILTALLISELVYSSYPQWFFFATAGISAVISLISSLLSYFVVKDSISKISGKLIEIEAEELLYKNKTIKKYQEKNRDFSYYVSIASILGINAAEKGGKYV